MFKKVLLLLAGLSFTSFAYAEEKIDIIQFGKTGAQGDRMITYIADSLGDQFGERIVVDNCASGKDVLMQTDRPTVIAWYNELQAPQADGSPNPCALSKNEFLGYLAGAPWSICHRTDNSQATIEYLKTGNIRVGTWQSGYYAPRFDSIITAINPNARIIPYKKGSEYRAALAAGEIDFSISTIAKDGETCSVILAPEITNEAQIRGIDLAPDNQHAILSYTYFLAGVNMDNINIDILDNLYSSEAWANRRDDRYFPVYQDKTLDEQWEILN